MLARLRHLTRGRRGHAFRAFLRGFGRPLRIVDLGGTVSFWEGWGLTAADGLHVVLINNHVADTSHRDETSRQEFLENRNRDATSLSREELAAFDLIFSNSFLEHLGAPSVQADLARKIEASGRPYFIQVPNKWSPIDPHFPRPYVPFFATYPRGLQARLLTWDGLGSSGASPSLAVAMKRLSHYVPLGRGDMRRLFPSAHLEVERPFGLPMSILAHRMAPAY